ncbi:MAG: DUF3368 domain-containing protein [Symploca sp. SIO2E6]|nr:DUF3368 domain-containing protein [Symploca sp. SIO2E6]
MIVISDTTPLSELAKVGQMNLLGLVFRQVILPQEVYDEVTTGTHPAVTAVKSADWIKVFSVKNPEKVSDLRALTKLGLGECAAIVLAEELNAQRLLIDDFEARQEAISRNLPVIGTVGILLLAKEQGLINSVKEILDALMAQNTRISPKLYQYALTIAQE